MTITGTNPGGGSNPPQHRPHPHEGRCEVSEQIVDLIEAVMPGPRGLTGPQGPQGLPGVNAVDNDEAVASYIGSERSGTASALAECWPRFSRRRFVVFGDSWTTPLAGGACIPEEAVSLVGGSITANYGVAGALLAPVTMTANCLEAQANVAAVDRSLVSDVLVIMGVNNPNGADTTYLPDEATCRNLFEGLRMYPNARYWYAADSKRCVNTDQAAWTFSTSGSCKARTTRGSPRPGTAPCGIGGATTCGTPTTPAPGTWARPGSTCGPPGSPHGSTGRNGNPTSACPSACTTTCTRSTRTRT